ncbi:uncharacterized protein C8Q71DRAFT_784920 [Rhodofomes roseus]|uniref:Uncharacterized protein n=1 Tax=Rhodofomes roseus TaxID=34475 RepID=A0ABQ8K258_9APHY|nr:uncharacterized protein C8Q71DRAFT_784920 [Rhodofomes roseus]KAH9830568.1 hypothetical protein C8Q71DRAFT_784920 [Rhodofomes roseus]
MRRHNSGGSRQVPHAPPRTRIRRKSEGANAVGPPHRPQCPFHSRIRSSTASVLEERIQSPKHSASSDLLPSESHTRTRRTRKHPASLPSCRAEPESRGARSVGGVLSSPFTSLPLLPSPRVRTTRAHGTRPASSPSLRPRADAGSGSGSGSGAPWRGRRGR